MAFGRKKAKQDAEDLQRLASEIATVRRILTQYPQGILPHFGSPTRCPDCGDYGMISSVNQLAGSCRNLCRVCGQTWIITRRAMDAVSAEPTEDALPVEDPEHVTDRVELARRELALAEERAQEARAQAERAEQERAEQLRAEAERARVEAEAAEQARLEAHRARAEAERAERERAEQARARAERERADEARAEVEHAKRSRAEQARSRAERRGPIHAESDLGEVDLTSQVAALRVLLVEDNPFDVAMIEDLLEPFVATGDAEIQHRSTRKQGEDAARTEQFDVVILDLHLPDSNGLTTVLEWQHHLPEPLPLIALIDEADADLIEQSRSAGVRAVIQKAHLERLAGQGEEGGLRLLKLLGGASARAVKATTDEPPDPANRFRPKNATR